MSNIKLGKIITGRVERDAVHIAIAPAVATMVLTPGRPVGIDSFGGASPLHNPIGIVDPFLTVPVEIGQRFWLFMYPDTVKSLHHDWTHPAFDGDEGDDDDAPSHARRDDYCQTGCIDH